MTHHAIDVLGGSKKKAAMADTWGHLYPEPGSKHKGTIYLSTGWGMCTIMDDDFPTLCDSPMKHELVCSAVHEFGLDSSKPAVYRIDCVLWFFKHCDDMYSGEKIGRIIKPKISVVWGK